MIQPVVCAVKIFLKTFLLLYLFKNPLVRIKIPDFPSSPGLPHEIRTSVSLSGTATQISSTAIKFMRFFTFAF